MKKVNIFEKLETFDEYWKPKVIGKLNGQLVKLVKGLGEFVWHKHDVEDELFYVVKGQLVIKLRERDVVLNVGEFFVVPHGVEHKPIANEEVHLLLFEPDSTLNTGDVKNNLTVDKLDSI
jgi:mannose-6-phosphate isomerase-like protein (cupin superfamily)